MPVTNNLTLNSVRKRLPARVISGFMSSAIALESWLYDDGLGDPWWQGAAGVACRWTITCTVNIVNHSSHLTRQPFVYSGLDITHNMWVMGSTEAKALRVISIKNKTDTTIECVVEDVDRYNTFSDTSGSGSGIFSSPLNVIFFELGEDGLPVIHPIPAGIDIGVISQVEARFRVQNNALEHRFFQLHHGFKEGQVLRLNKDTGLFSNATSDDIFMIGTVTSIGPGPNHFYLEPSTKYIANLEPALAGTAGDIVWLDPITGDRTTVPNGSNVPIYVQMTNAVPSFVIGTVDNPTTDAANIVNINGVQVSLGTTGTANATTIVQRINTSSINHGVTASLSAPATIVNSTTFYPETTPTTATAFSINGVALSMSSPSVNFGVTGKIGFWDVVRAVNEQTDFHGVTATMNLFNGVLTLEHRGAGPINIVNVNPTVTTGLDKTFTDMLGISANNPPAAATRLKLTRSDGGEIILANVVGSFLANTGVQSVGNGVMPLALVVDKTMISTANLVVADLDARDALVNVRAGDQVFVQSAAYGEWALYLHSGTSWIMIADYDSAKTDASTLHNIVSYTSSSPVVLGSLSDGARVVNVTVVVEEAFSPGATITIGFTGDEDALMSSDIMDLTDLGTYETSPAYTFSGSSGGIVKAFVDVDDSTTGIAKVIVSYL